MSNYPWKCLQDIEFQYKIVLLLQKVTPQKHFKKRNRRKKLMNYPGITYANLSISYHIVDNLFLFLYVFSSNLYEHGEYDFLDNALHTVL